MNKNCEVLKKLGNIKNKISPKTDLGKWSGRLAGLFAILFATAQIIALIGRAQDAFEQERSKFYVVIFPTILIPAGISAIAALVSGLLSIIEFFLVYIATLLGLFVLLFLIGEFSSAH